MSALVTRRGFQSGGSKIGKEKDIDKDKGKRVAEMGLDDSLRE